MLEPMPAVTLVVGDEEFLVARAVQRAVNAAVAGGDAAGVHDVAAVDARLRASWPS